MTILVRWTQRSVGDNLFLSLGINEPVPDPDPLDQCAGKLLFPRQESGLTGIETTEAMEHMLRYVTVVSNLWIS